MSLGPFSNSPWEPSLSCLPEQAASPPEEILGPLFYPPLKVLLWHQRHLFTQHLHFSFSRSGSYLRLRCHHAFSLKSISTLMVPGHLGHNSGEPGLTVWPPKLDPPPTFPFQRTSPSSQERSFRDQLWVPPRFISNFQSASHLSVLLAAASLCPSVS